MVVKGQAAALMATAIAFACRLALDPFLGDHLPYVTFFVAIAFTTWYAGLAAAATATLLGGIVSLWFFIPPRLSFAIADVSQQVGLATYAAVSVTFIVFGQAMHRARQRAEDLAQGIRVTEERLALAQQASAIGSFDLDVHTGFNTWSPELYAIYGLSSEQFGNTQASWERCLHPDDREATVEAVERSRTSGKAEEREFRIVRPNGDIRWLVGRWRWIRNSDGRTVRLAGVNFDITERKRAEESLRESEARSRAIFESSLDPLITMDADGRIEDFNPAAEHLFAYSKAQAVGRTVSDLIIPPHWRERYRQWLRDCDETGQGAVLGRRIRMPALRADRTEVPVEFSISATKRSGAPAFFTAHFRDISERLRSERATAHLAAIVTSTDDAIISKDLHGIVTSWNQGAEKLFGYRASEMIGQPVLKLIPPERHDEEVRILDKISRGETIDTYETIRRRKNGTEFHVSLTISPLFDAGGRVIGASKIARDITERVQHQQVLVENQRMTAQLAAIVTSTDDAIVSKDLHGIVTSWNQGAEKLFGYRASEMIGQPVLKLIPPERHDEEVRILDKISRGETIDTYETIRRRKDGSEFHVSLTISPLFDAGGNVIGASKIARDITERVEHEKMLAQSRERLRQALQYQEAIVGNMGEGLYTLNRQGHVVSMNRAAEQLLGWKKDELLGKSTHDLTHYKHPDGRPFAQEDCAVLQVFKTGVACFNHEDVFIRKDGSFFDVVCSVSPIWSADDVTGLIVVFRDVTEQKRAEQVLRDRDRALTAANEELSEQKAGLAEANRELQSFSYSVSHDLRAPLRTIDAYVRIIEEDHGPELNGEVRRCLGIMRKAAGQAGELIDDLLEFSRLGRIGMDFRATRMYEIVREVTNELALTQSRPHLDVTIGDLPDCHGDWRLLKLVWANLMSNAFKFTRGRPVTQIEVGWLPDDRQADASVYYVKDNGVGFDMKYVHKLFGVFQRLHLKEDFEGTGVGLAIVQRIVQRHGGRVWAEAKVDGGATFFFSVRKAMR